MLLLHTTGCVKIGEIVRSTVTYTPSLDPLTPLPKNIHLRIKNTASLPLRAAYLHGPYTIYVSVRRQEFDPYKRWKSEFEGEEVAVPQYEPNLKAGASFFATLCIPQQLRDDALAQVNSPDRPKSVTWIVEVISQSIFSTSATVGFEILLGRDEKSIGYGFPFGTGSYAGFPGAKGPPAAAEAVEMTGTGGAGGEQLHSGVLSGSIKLKVQDTADLWNLPPFPSWSEEHSESSFPSEQGNAYPDPDELDERERAREKGEEARRKKRVTKKVHLVIITHGLHSNTGADMLFMKEAIDEEARNTEAAYKQKKAQAREQKGMRASLDGSSEGKEIKEAEDADDREILIVRGFHENVCRTERGIKYLGRRLAKYILALADPHEPNPHPLQKPQPQQQQEQQTPPKKLRKQGQSSAKGGDAYAGPGSQESSGPRTPSKPPYKVTSISFIGHSLGGLVQTYAIAFIHAHHPQFFHEAKPINFVALASPFLGLSNENPMYVKFALDFGLVGRTGKDLGLTWRAPNMAASALQALTTPFSNSKEWQNKGKSDPTKPLLRILPTGPASDVLKMFRNRTVYANVVNDGIVPLRTSCLLYLDWKGLDKVEKARRENAAGQVVGLVGWGWGQLTTNSPSPRMSTLINTSSQTATDTSQVSLPQGDGDQPTAATNTTTTTTTAASTSIVLEECEDDVKASPEALGSDKLMLESHSGQSAGVDSNPFDHHQTVRTPSTLVPSPQPINEPNNPFSSFMTLFRPQAGKKAHQDRAPKIYRRSQITPVQSPTPGSPYGPPSPAILSPDLPSPTGQNGSPSILTTFDDFDNNIFAPPKTSFLEAAGDVLNPPLPPVEYLINPDARPKTIWHDRVYHAEDIPSPPLKTKTKSMLGLKLPGSSDTLQQSQAQDSVPKSTEAGQSPTRKETSSSNESSNAQAAAQLKVEEKIARAYHKDLSWRKVLVKLEPDAHNNIIVRRMFANAHGWPVVQHVVQTHFADTPEAKTADIEENRGERVSVRTDQSLHPDRRIEAGKLKTASTTTTEVTTTNISRNGAVEEAEVATATTSMVEKKRSLTNSTEDSGLWSDAAFEITDDEDSDIEVAGGASTGVGGESTPKGAGTSASFNVAGISTPWNAGGLGIRWPLGGNSAGGGAAGEATSSTAATNTNTSTASANEDNRPFMNSTLSQTHSTAPRPTVSKVDAWGRGGGGSSGPASGSDRESIDGGMGRMVLDDAVKIGLGSHAMRELTKVRSRSGQDVAKRNSMTSPSAAMEDDERSADEGFAERVNRLSQLG